VHTLLKGWFNLWIKIIQTVNSAKTYQLPQLILYRFDLKVLLTTNDGVPLYRPTFENP